MTGGGSDEKTPAIRNPTARIGVKLIVALGLLVVVAANAHLVYVAFTSRPACVGHLKERDGASRPGSFRAAASSC